MLKTGDMLEMIGIYGEMRSYVKFSLQEKMFGYISYYIKALKTTIMQRVGGHWSHLVIWGGVISVMMKCEIHK